MAARDASRLRDSLARISSAAVSSERKAELKASVISGDVVGALARLDTLLAGGDVFTCPRCTFVNAAGLDACDACGTARGAGGGVGGGGGRTWVCGVCETANEVRVPSNESLVMLQSSHTHNTTCVV